MVRICSGPYAYPVLAHSRTQRNHIFLCVRRYVFFFTKFFSCFCEELELACFIMFSSRYSSRSFFSSVINSLSPSHRSAVCLLSCSCALFLLLSRCLIYPARFWKGGNVASGPYAYPVLAHSRSQRKHIFLCRLYSSLFFRGPSDQHTSPSARSRVLLLISLKLVLLKNLVTNLQ